jgi:hypothetical protein
VVSLIHSSLRDLCFARNVPFDERRVAHRLSASEVVGGPTTALVLAVYRAEGWSTAPN